MVPLDRALLGELMAAMAAGDRAALFRFVVDFGDTLARVVRGVLADFGRRDLLRDRDEIDGLVQDIALVIFERAGSWDPQGAPPWVWAERAIRAEVVRAIGHATVELEVDRHDAPVDGHGPGEVDLDELRRHPEFVLFWDELVEQVGSERDRLVVREYLQQLAGGDRSPAHTVGAQFDMNPDAVRQAVRRMRVRMRRRAGDDPRYRALREQGWLAA